MNERRFARIRVLALLGALAFPAAASPPAAAAVEGAFSMEILVDGLPAAELSACDRRYIEAVEGREYAIRLTNRTSDRVAIALAVDGLNSIDARTTTAYEAAKWILGPRQSVVVQGWQTGPDTARKFFFTTEEESYGAWLGRASNLGVITAAVFRERRLRRPITGVAPRGDGKSSSRRAPEPLAEAFDEDAAATGIGRRVDHRVRRVAFEAEASPVALIELRYEYRDALVRLGLLPAPLARETLERRERARGFLEQDFAPDPFRR
jgi:hypothetical protein